MAKKPRLFSRASTTPTVRLGKQHQTVTELPNDAVSVAKRRDQRNRLPDFDATGLLMRYETHNKRKPVFYRDLSALAAAYPHHRLLIQQLLVGVSLHFGLKTYAYQSYQTSHIGIENFIAFLNSDEPLPNNPTCTADLSYAVGRLFSAWLIRKYPARANNRRLYGNLRKAIVALQKKHAQHSMVGSIAEWPPAPRHSDQRSESYPGATLNALVDACLQDVKYVIGRMSSFPTQVGQALPFEESEGGTKLHLTAAQMEWRAMATAHRMYPTWPFGMSLEEATATFSWDKSSTQYHKKRSTERARRLIQKLSFGPEGKEMTHGQNAYFSHFALLSASLYPFVLLVQINTGWNLESVLALSLPVDNHIEPDLVDEHYCVIYSSKHRTEKSVWHRTNKKSPYGVYRILKFVEKMVTRHSSSQHFLPGQLWQFAINKNLWMKTGTMMTVPTSQTINLHSAAFVARHQIAIDTDAKVPVIEARRLRTTVQTKRRQQGLTIDQMQGLQGHSDIDTTSIHYDDDAGAVELKNQQIRKLQERHITDFGNYHARLAQSTTLQELREALQDVTQIRQHLRFVRADAVIELTQEQVIHLLSPAGQTYIAACTNSLVPTWPSAEKFVTAGDQCRFFNRCSMCDKALIFKEALPWVARRIRDLNELRLMIPASDWAINYEDEYAGWQWVLGNWSNREDVAQAEALATTDAYILPNTMMGAV